MIERIKQWLNKKYLGDSGIYPEGSCIDFLYVFIKNTKNESDRVKFILNCMISSDNTTRNVIYSVIRDHYPQYNKVLENPNKYRILL
jgi:hypothetical protein